jgi:NTE family protein
VSFEAGNVYSRRGDLGWNSARKDGSVFLGLDTLLGPLYIGSGYDELGHSAYYLFLGRTF